MAVFIRIILIFAVLCGTTPLFAFHDGGVASCSSCHMMHGSGGEYDVPPSIDNNYLLLSETPTELCLSCHATDQGSVWAVNPFLPAPEHGGGNFIFATATNINDAPDGALFPLAGSHGVHNCVALSRGVLADAMNTHAPGGTYPSASLGCTSCHDPHGNTNFRMLRGAGHVPAGDFYFTSSAPIAEGITTTGPAESPSLHTAYKSGWSNWCANCHGMYHRNAQNAFQHPVDRAIDKDTRNSYGLYDGTDNPTGGTPLSSYIPELPFEDNTLTATSTNGPGPSSRIACITCHRAHGSSATDLGRWDFRALNLQNDGVVSGSFPIPSPYTSANERQLCVKCHKHDTRTHGLNQACIECHRTNIDDLRTLPARRETPAK
jgi:Zn-finger protein